MAPAHPRHMGRWDRNVANKHTFWGLSPLWPSYWTCLCWFSFCLCKVGPLVKQLRGSHIKAARIICCSFCLFPAHSLRTTFDYHQPNYACPGFSWLTVPGTAPGLLSPDAPDELPVVTGGWPQPHIGSRAAAGPLAG